MSPLHRPVTDRFLAFVLGAGLSGDACGPLEAANAALVVDAVVEPHKQKKQQKTAQKDRQNHD